MFSSYNILLLCELETLTLVKEEPNIRGTYRGSSRVVVMEVALSHLCYLRMAS